MYCAKCGKEIVFVYSNRRKRKVWMHVKNEHRHCHPGMVATPRED